MRIRAPDPKLSISGSHLWSMKKDVDNAVLCSRFAPFTRHRHVNVNPQSRDRGKGKPCHYAIQDPPANQIVRISRVSHRFSSILELRTSSTALCLWRNPSAEYREQRQYQKQDWVKGSRTSQEVDDIQRKTTESQVGWPDTVSNHQTQSWGGIRNSAAYKSMTFLYSVLDTEHYHSILHVCYLQYFADQISRSHFPSCFKLFSSRIFHTTATLLWPRMCLWILVSSCSFALARISGPDDLDHLPSRPTGLLEHQNITPPHYTHGNSRLTTKHRDTHWHTKSTLLYSSQKCGSCQVAHRGHQFYTCKVIATILT